MSILDYSFLLHGVIEGLVGLLYLIRPADVPDLKINDPSAVFLAQAFGASLIASAIPAIFMFGLPNMLPCKRTAGLGYMVFHSLIAWIFFQSRMDGPFDTTTAWTMCLLHLGLFTPFYLWYKVTGDQVTKFIKQSKNQAVGGPGKAK
ncbi:hypothetical protein DM01DRAFT_1334488 [Hesseltinella vesiculosa]|uniref:Uncharacterized protein n=1 Tax=Hesseltinella vesiculosa TaxID=101127 RepID=A0A1X2GM96_9FUNG|nr:hypothetical protein DM01DRAFT_1334488 [Hesseltinella vesiculosa]